MSKNGLVQMGAIVDSVSEILDVMISEIEETPSLSVDLKTDYILALAKLNGNVNILLDIDKVLNSLEKVAVGEIA